MGHRMQPVVTAAGSLVAVRPWVGGRLCRRSMALASRHVARRCRCRVVAPYKDGLLFSSSSCVMLHGFPRPRLQRPTYTRRRPHAAFVACLG